MDGWIDGWMDGWMDLDGWIGMEWDGMDGCNDVYIYIYTFINIYIDKYIDVDIDRLCRHVHIHIHIHYMYTCIDLRTKNTLQRYCRLRAWQKSFRHGAPDQEIGHEKGLWQRL